MLNEYGECGAVRGESLIRNEPGEYRVAAVPFPDGGFAVRGESVHPVTLTIRVEDAWERLPPEARRFSYTATVRRDGEKTPSAVLSDVAPDARIFLDFSSAFEIVFS